MASLRFPMASTAAASLAALAGVCLFFAAMIVFAANPFFRPAGQVPADGDGLNPMLQDPGMIAHPPVLFLGYAGYTIPFAAMVGALVARRRRAGREGKPRTLTRVKNLSFLRPLAA